MEVVQTRKSRKRKQPPSSSSTNSTPFVGILTRNKSHKFFFHHNRSGKSRPTRSFPSSLTNPTLPTNHKLHHTNQHYPPVVVDDKDDEIYHISIKDLRARRVFSTPPKSEVVCKDADADADVQVGKNVDPIFDSEDRKLDEVVDGKSDGNNTIFENPSLSVLEKCVDSRVDECFSSGNPNFSGEDLKPRNDEDCEELVLTTPPDAVVLVRLNDEQSGLKSRSTDSRSPPKKISPSKGASVEGKKNLPISKRNLGLNPCSRLKVFKTPNSFSYRRLLPFLMDMDLAKDTPNVILGAPKVNPSIKIGTVVEEKPLGNTTFKETEIDRARMDEASLATEAACKPQEVNTITNSSSVQAAPCNPVDCPLEKSQEHPVSDETPIATPVSYCFNENGGALSDGQASLDHLKKSKSIDTIVESDLTATLHSPERSCEPSKEDAILNSPSQSSVHAERECSPAHRELKCEECVVHSSSKVEAVVSSGLPGFGGLGKGILKRNPRGCRGICNCLNCASFRLNAEKAFEFSRNQWFDAEELAMDLMKQLSSLRCMLEKSLDGANDNAIVPVDQVQEICKRASDAEEIARSRLTQMDEDLHVHCRIRPLQRPRVTFSGSGEKIKEKLT